MDFFFRKKIILLLKSLRTTDLDKTRSYIVFAVSIFHLELTLNFLGASDSSQSGASNSNTATNNNNGGSSGGTGRMLFNNQIRSDASLLRRLRALFSGK